MSEIRQQRWRVIEVLQLIASEAQQLAYEKDVPIADQVEYLPESEGTVQTWLASPDWRLVMEAAKRCLERIELLDATPGIGIPPP